MAGEMIVAQKLACVSKSQNTLREFCLYLVFCGLVFFVLGFFKYHTRQELENTFPVTSGKASA